MNELLQQQFIDYLVGVLQPTSTEDFERQLQNMGDEGINQYWENFNRERGEALPDSVTPIRKTQNIQTQPMYETGGRLKYLKKIAKAQGGVELPGATINAKNSMPRLTSIAAPLMPTSNTLPVLTPPTTLGQTPKGYGFKKAVEQFNTWGDKNLRGITGSSATNTGNTTQGARGPIQPTQGIGGALSLAGNAVADVLNTIPHRTNSKMKYIS